ncbi:MAG: argininosuccinate synthase [Treponema sp.]|nr:argininosuccinate synthase [Treponema sp.]
MKKKIVFAYSGGIDSTAGITWLKENQDCEIIAVCVDVGQAADWKAIQKRASAAGAGTCYIADVKKEYVEGYIWPALKAGAMYEEKHLLGASIAKPLIVKVLAEYARKEKAAAIAHGSKANDQLDFCIKALAPELETIAPWRIWKLKSREDAVRYLTRRKIPIHAKKKNSYRTEKTLWQVSHKGLELENPSTEPMYKKILTMTVTPEKAPNKPVYIDIDFEKGIPSALNGKKMEGLALISQLNKIGGAYGIGISDLVESISGANKIRSVYEAPGAGILYYAQKELEHLCLDKASFSFKQRISIKFSELIYDGFWFTPLFKALCAFVDSTQQTVNGKVKLKLYKGSISTAGTSSPNSLYKTDIAANEKKVISKKTKVKK